MLVMVVMEEHQLEWQRHFSHYIDWFENDSGDHFTIDPRGPNGISDGPKGKQLPGFALVLDILICMSHGT